ncbi:hypothetical protein KY284_035920 [Solanum tuberosum]|nr:hypothetical protein KY284_035920 [Solanum tuberosum]
MKFSLCKNFGHDKKGCPIALLKVHDVMVEVLVQLLEDQSLLQQLLKGQQLLSTIGTSDSKRSSKVKRGGANLRYKSPRTTGFRVLFGATGSVIKRFGTSDTLLHCAILKMPAPTNIALGYKPNGLRWKGGTAVTQRQLQEQSYKRGNSSTRTHATTSTQSKRTHVTPAML